MPLVEALDQRIVAREPPVNEYTADLVRGVTEHRPRLDEVLVDVLPGLDARPDARRRPQRRCGSAIFELLYVDDVPDAVAVTEALNLVRDLSTDESPAFVNGVLGTIVRNKGSLSA